MQFSQQWLTLGVLANESYGHTIRTSTPKIIEDSELDSMCERLEQVLVP